jgi:Protein of unknown function (DUF3089)
MFKKIVYLYFILLILASFSSYSQKHFQIVVPFDKNNLPPSPNYSEMKNWAAHPDISDFADIIPENKLNLKDGQSEAQVDVFFVYPTIYTHQPTNKYTWNADVSDKELNVRIDTKTIKNQLTVFNGSCKIYSPRYRQAHYAVFTTSDSISAKSAIDLAYEDVKMAFEYYLKNYNYGRPIIIAGHSQGTLHAIRLLQDYFDTTELKNKLVEAYLVGMPVNDGMFSNIKLSTSPNQTGGYVSWNTFSKGFYPSYYKNGLNKATLVNPISWRADTTFTSYKDAKGTLGLKFKISSHIISAKTQDGLLWIDKPKIFGAAMIKTKIWHFADYNLFWMDIRDNVNLRINSFINR